MQELYLTKPSEIQLRQVDPLPSPVGDEIKVKTIYGGICGSDLSVYRGKLKHATYPLRPGHELVGTVIEAGAEAKYGTGTRVVVLPNTFCGECDLCLQGRTNICSNKKSLGVNTDGGFAEEFTISSQFVLQVPDDLPDEKAVLIEPIAVVVHAFKNVKITEGTKVAIVGSGNEGMIAAALAYHLGAIVTAIDINPKKHEMIKRIGDIHTAFPQDIQNETFDVVVEAAGAKSSFEQAVQLVRPGGAMVLIGLVPEANVPIIHIVRNEITLFGSIIYNFPSDYEQTIAYLRDSNFNIEPVVSQIIPLADYRIAYENALSGDFGKIILKF